MEIDNDKVAKLWETGQLELLAALQESVLSREPNNAAAMVNAATFRIRLGQFDQAEALAAKAQRIESHNQQARSIVATIQKSTLITQWVAADGIQVSIVIPSYNNAAKLKRCLESIAANSGTVNYEVVIVDNDSEPETRGLLASELAGPKTKVIYNSVNLGYARASNQGARQASGRHLLFLNNDTEVQPGWLEPLLEGLEDSQVGAVGSKLLFPDGRVQHAGVVVINDQHHDIPLTASHLCLHESADTPRANERRLCQSLTAACLLVRRQAFFEVGGFDEGYWNGFEDVDLCFKLGERCWLRVYEPRSVVIHHEMQGGVERVVRFGQNAQRLCSRWLAKITPDMILSPEGNRDWSGSSIRPYPKKECA